ncbi:MAG: sigma-70 family RNA polymerase sigma factor [Candidatus Omnitrophica bacterium]|nr:sigma-70 family RNA polymerase sigma factor [Candidatus Omnitrophota bacterium]MDD5437214.1 sigma-70 family RNA polymerase sigma factor [Candidatus Omnitrophota bacterium]
MFPRPREDDQGLVEACIKKDAEAWAIFVKKYSGLISLSIANRLRRCGFDPSCEDAEDIRQDLLASIWAKDKLGKVRNRKSVACWLAITAGNAAITHVRRKLADKNLKFTPLSDSPDAEGLPIDPGMPNKKELYEHFEKIVAALPPKEGLIIKLNLLDGMEYRQIADMLNIPKGTVSSYIKRAKEKLRKRLSRQGWD